MSVEPKEIIRRMFKVNMDPEAIVRVAYGIGATSEDYSTVVQEEVKKRLNELGEKTRQERELSKSILFVQGPKELFEVTDRYIEEHSTNPTMLGDWYKRRREISEKVTYEFYEPQIVPTILLKLLRRKQIPFEYHFPGTVGGIGARSVVFISQTIKEDILDEIIVLGYERALYQPLTKRRYEVLSKYASKDFRILFGSLELSSDRIEKRRRLLA